MVRLREKYRTEIVPQLKDELNQQNELALPKLEKIVVNMGVGSASQNKAHLESAVNDLRIITGQQPLICKARQSVASFKLREGQEIGAKVTLRGARMYEFLDRLISVAIPRIRDFQGLSPKAFDGNGNYSMGIQEQITFPEINIDKVDRTQGMDITIVMNSGDVEASRTLLRKFGMPFKDMHPTS